ncbi:MAG: type VI secretion system tube protein Hcp [Planctomycetes bacterium]|nr:type VI secretion system tube protein Hcp [Planctomycetota bacterium]
MKLIHLRTYFLAVVLVVVSIVFMGDSYCGELDPNAPPGATMHTLEQLYQVNKNLSHPAGFVAAQSGMVGAYDGFMQIGNIPGESEDQNHRDWIEVLSYHQGITMDVDSGASHPSGVAEFSEITVIKRIDKATPLLAFCCAQGQHIPQVTIEFCRAAGDKIVYMKVILEDALVSGVNMMILPMGGADVLPMEEVSFRYGRIEWEYTGVDENDDPLPAIQRGWDIEANQAG